MSTVITISHLKKYYQVHKKEPGIVGSLNSLFHRKYEAVKAIDDVSFQIKAGELIGFIGPNGAGKTTTLKCLSGLLYPDSGEVSVLGFKPFERKKEFLKQISLVMGQKNQLWWDLPPMDSLILYKEIYEINDTDFKERITELSELFDMKELVKVPVRKLSLGQRMKAELMAALIHKPKVLFLDEPTIGLDVVMQQKIRDFVKAYNQRYQATIILTSHYMDDVAELCERVIVIDTGKILYDGALSKIVKKYARNKIITVVLEKDVDAKKIGEIGYVKDYNFPRAVFTVPVKKASAVSSRILTDLPVADLTIQDPPIEAIIREMFSEK